MSIFPNCLAGGKLVLENSGTDTEQLLHKNEASLQQETTNDQQTTLQSYNKDEKMTVLHSKA